MSSAEQYKKQDDQDADIVNIRLEDVVTFLKRSRKSILVGALIGLVVGFAYAISLPTKYESQITVLPEFQTKNGSTLNNLGSLAGLAGIDLNNMTAGTDAVRPELYPNVLQSTPFAMSLFKKPVYERGSNKPELFENYWGRYQKGGLLDWLPLSFGGNETEFELDPSGKSGALQMTKRQEVMHKSLRENVLATFDKKSGLLTISSTMQDPVVAAHVANLSLAYLSEYVTSYRTEKARREVEFLTKQVAEAKRRYQNAEYNLSAYRDQNRSLYLNTAKIEEQRIQAEFLLSQDLYNMLSKQAEMAKIKVQEDTPVFKVLNPSNIPLQKKQNKSVLYVVGIALLGTALGLLISFISNVRKVYF